MYNIYYPHANINLRLEYDIMSQVNINIRMDEDLKEKFNVICDEMGLTMTAAFNVFARAVIYKRAIPFEITADNDPFYSFSNMERLSKAIANLEAGKGTFHELIEVDDDE